MNPYDELPPEKRIRVQSSETSTSSESVSQTKLETQAHLRKRVIVGAEAERSKESAPKSTIAKQQVDESVALDGSSVNEEKTLASLRKHLSNDKKFLKASKLFEHFIDARLNESNADLFFSTVETLMCDCPQRDISQAMYSSSYCSIFDSLHSKLTYFDPVQRYKLSTYFHYGHTRLKLLTDDSFQFSKAVRVVKEVIDSMSEDSRDLEVIEGEEGEGLHVERQRVLLSCIETALRSYHLTWAKQPVISLTSAAAGRRANFVESLREELGEFTVSHEIILFIFL